MLCIISQLERVYVHLTDWRMDTIHHWAIRQIRYCILRISIFLQNFVSYASVRLQDVRPKKNTNYLVAVVGWFAYGMCPQRSNTLPIKNQLNGFHWTHRHVRVKKNPVKIVSHCYRPDVIIVSMMKWTMHKRQNIISVRISYVCICAIW